MNISEVMALFGDVELPVIGALTPETALFGLSVAFFAFAAGMCGLAVRASNAARDAEDDARVMMRTVQDYAVEVRQMAARAEKHSLAAESVQETLADRIHGVRVGARHDAGEADVALELEPEDVVAPSDIADDEQLSHEEDGIDDEASNARLADATRAATEPRSLLSGMLRRR